MYNDSDIESFGNSSFEFQSDWNDKIESTADSKPFPSSCYESDYESEEASISSSDCDKEDELNFINRNCFQERRTHVNTFSSTVGELP